MGPPTGSDAWIDDRHVRADGQVGQRAPQQQRAMTDVVLVDLVADVDDERFGCDAQDHAVADGRGRIARAPIREQADEA
jgi:hypothetical protein